MEKTEVTCPKCGQPSELPMPSDRSVVMFECPHCHTRSKALDGKCCVFCSYGTKHCPACTCFGDQGSALGTHGSQDLPSNPSNSSNQDIGSK